MAVISNESHFFLVASLIWFQRFPWKKNCTTQGGGCVCVCVCMLTLYVVWNVHHNATETNIIFWFRKKAMMVLHWQWGHWRLPGPLVNNISVTMSSSYFSQWLTQIWHVEQFDAEKKTLACPIHCMKHENIFAFPIKSWYWDGCGNKNESL